LYYSHHRDGSGQRCGWSLCSAALHGRTLAIWRTNGQVCGGPLNDPAPADQVRGPHSAPGSDRGGESGWLDTASELGLMRCPAGCPDSAVIDLEQAED
jgi:hypothetical protein